MCICEGMCVCVCGWWVWGGLYALYCVCVQLSVGVCVNAYVCGWSGYVCGCAGACEWSEVHPFPGCEGGLMWFVMYPTISISSGVYVWCTWRSQWYRAIWRIAHAATTGQLEFLHHGTQSTQMHHVVFMHIYVHGLHYNTYACIRWCLLNGLVAMSGQTLAIWQWIIGWMVVNS